MKCPDCHGELVKDPKNPDKLLCYECKHRYDRMQLENYYKDDDEFKDVDLENRYDREEDNFQYYPNGDTDQMEPIRQTAPYDPNTIEAPINKTLSIVMSGVPLVLGLAAVILVWWPNFGSIAAILGLISAVLGVVAIGMHVKGVAPAVSVALGSFAIVVFGIITLVSISLTFIEESGIGNDAQNVYQDTKNTYNDVKNMYGEAKNTGENVYNDAKNVYNGAKNVANTAENIANTAEDIANGAEEIIDGTSSPSPEESPSETEKPWSFDDIANMGQDGLNILQEQIQRGKEYLNFGDGSTW